MAPAGEISDDGVCIVILEPRRDVFQGADVPGWVTAGAGVKKMSFCTF